MQIPRLMIASPQGRSGKTTIAVGLCAALRKMGLQVKPFKKGPDYIDPSWLGAAAGNGCNNLDPFLCDQNSLLKGFQEKSIGADLALIEASMGLYDSSSEDGHGSSAWLSRQLKMPVIMVINSSRMTRSAAAMVRGYMDFEPGTMIAGVILNNVAGVRHVDTIVKALEHHCGIPVLGALPKDACLNINERHLGIVPFKEQNEANEMIERISTIFKNHADIEKILQIARSASDIPDHKREAIHASGYAAKVGILADKAFTFYYPENLEALQKAGAELIYINSFSDKNLPAVDAMYIGGGFPEIYADELEANANLRKDIAESAENGLPIYAECGGLIYLCRSILKEGKTYRMCGVIKADAQIEARPQGHGYVVAKIVSEIPLFEKGYTLSGHEFHHSRLINGDSLNCAYRIVRGHGVDGLSDGIVYRNVLASYIHIHAWGVPLWANNFVKFAAVRRKTNKVTV
ncbi:MAG: hydrogenobyrinic acid a,c-diamide synthase (glutamine-hydrolyzing) [Dehalococcoidia bacterium]|nr:MAG: hydrogenobyrinic acid a,c-diamide synthase (glutamine-hydrolyzing) [Dehalococcoidia bacterium]